MTITHAFLVVPVYRSLPAVTSACVLLENMATFARMVRQNSPLPHLLLPKNFCRFRNYRAKFFIDSAWFVVLCSISNTVRHFTKHGNPFQIHSNDDGSNFDFDVFGAKRPTRSVLRSHGCKFCERLRYAHLEFRFR